MPFYIGGLQLRTIEIEQCIELISSIITCFSYALITRDLMKHSLEYLQLEVDWNELILLVDYTKLHKFYTNR